MKMDVLDRVGSHGCLLVFRRKNARALHLPLYVVGHVDGRMFEDFRTLRKARSWARTNKDG
jgi:hypothetical protein